MKDKKEKARKLPEGQAFLLTASDNLEASIIESKLMADNIPVTKLFQGSGDFFTIILGKTLMGIDLFVPEEMLQKAIEILDSAKDIEDEQILLDPSFNEEDVTRQNEDELNSLSKKALWMGVALLVIIVSCIIIYFLIK